MSVRDAAGNEYRVIDADGHAWEMPLVLWDKYLPSALRGRVFRSGIDPNGHWRMLFDGRLTMAHENGLVPDDAIARDELLDHHTRPRATPTGSRASFDQVPRGHPESPAGRLADMDIEGIDTAILYPSIGLVWLATAKLDLAIACARAQNDLLADFASDCGGRVRPALSLPLVAPTRDCVDAALKELAHGVNDLGMRSVFMLPSVRRANLDEPFLYPLYEEIERLGLPIGIHWGAGTWLPGSEERFKPDQFVLAHTIGFPLEAMVALGSIVCGGLPEKFPRLKWAILESGVGWIHYFMERLDEHYERLPQLLPAMKRWPREYLKSGLIYYSCDPDEASLPFILEMMGDDLIFYASDYPHWDGRFPESVAPLRDNPKLTSVQKRKVLAENAARFYGLATQADPSRICGAQLL